MQNPKTITKFEKIFFEKSENSDRIGVLVFSNDNIQCDTDIYLTDDKKDGVSFSELKDFAHKKQDKVKLFTHDVETNTIIVSFEYPHEGNVYEIRFFMDAQIFFDRIKIIIEQLRTELDYKICQDNRLR